MRRLLLAFVLVQAFGVAHAETCASNIEELRNIVQHADVPLRWRETTESKPARVLTLALSNGGAGIRVSLTLPDGTNWANLTGKICSDGNARQLTLRVNKGASSMGPGAPSIVRNRVPGSVSLTLNASYSQLRVKTPGLISYSGSYSPR